MLGYDIRDEFPRTKEMNIQRLDNSTNCKEMQENYDMISKISGI